MPKARLAHYLPWTLVAVVTIIFLPFSYLKLSDHQVSSMAFAEIAQWLSSIGLQADISDNFSRYGGIIVGFLELLAVVLLMLSRTRFWGALLGLALMSNALVCYMFLSQDIIRAIEEVAGFQEGAPMTIAIIAWISNALLVLLSRPANSKQTS